VKLSIKSKIIATATLAVALCLAINIFGGMKTNQNITIYQQIADVNFPNLEAQAEMEKASIKIEAVTNLLIGSNSTPEDALKSNNQLEVVLKDFNEALNKYENLPFADGEQDIWQNFKNDFWKKYLEGAKKIIALSGTNNSNDRVTRDSFAGPEWTTLLNSRDGEFKKLKDFQSNLVKINSDEARKSSSNLAWLLPLLTGIAGILSILISVLLGGAIARNLMKIVETINNSSSQVAFASSEIASSSQQLSEATVEQAASLEETSASLDEITSMIAKASDSATSTEKRSEESHRKAEEGKEAVEKMLQSMNEISQSNEAIMNQINKSNQEMTEIVKVIQDIGIKTNVINDIVFQTKLLSFNASVEAARAGEHGKGFAVVAEEVGNLAAMSGNAAKEITDMLSMSMSKVEQIVQNTKSRVEVLISQGKQKVESGVSVSKECSLVLEDIVKNVANVSTLANEIATASKEQSLGVQEINKAISQLDSATQQNSATSEQTATSARELANQADSLKHAVTDLIATVSGQTGAGSLPRIDSSNFHGSNVVPLKKPAKKVVQQNYLKSASGDKIPSSSDKNFEVI